MSRLRARVAERLLQSQSENAILTTFNEASMQAILDLRARYKEKFEKEHGIKLGFTSFFVKAALAAASNADRKNVWESETIHGTFQRRRNYVKIGRRSGRGRGGKERKKS